jgi:hypothetical protein
MTTRVDVPSATLNCRSTCSLGVQALADPRCLIEIEALAILD